MAPDGKHEIDINQRRSAMSKLKYLPASAPLILLNLHIQIRKQTSWAPLLHLHLVLSSMLYSYFILMKTSIYGLLHLLEGSQDLDTACILIPNMPTR